MQHDTTVKRNLNINASKHAPSYKLFDKDHIWVGCVKDILTRIVDEIVTRQA